ncbi:MAG: ABC transporter ATP-binding protein, partial [Verrucomicrobiaceae bacterium]
MPDPAPSPEGVVIDVRGVDKSFGDGSSRIHVLKAVDFEARSGEITMLVGPSGCGKTTLLSAIAGTMRVDGGQINVFGHSLEKMSGGALTRFRSERIGFIFQQFNLIPTLTVAENVSVPLLIQGVSSGKAIKRSREILEKVGLGERWKERPNKLSGGQQQRIAIARALVHEPPLVICDEPTA